MAIEGNDIVRIRTFSTAGTNEGPAHVFYNNNYAIGCSIGNEPLIFNIPTFSAVTGTYDYYGSSAKSILVIYTRPSFSLHFTGNTHVITGDSRLQYISQEIYKINHRDLLAYRADPSEGKWNVIKNSFEVPSVIYSAATSAVTSAFTMSILPDQTIKVEGRYTEDVFEDRCEYFVNTRFTFSIPDALSGTSSASTFNSISRIGSNGLITTAPYSAQTEITSNDNESSITQGAWSGETVYGLFFSCLRPPSKPMLEQPYPASVISAATTFTPTFFFSSLEDGDSFILQVTYDMTDTGFTNTTTFSGVTPYYLEKTDDSLEQVVNRTTSGVTGTDSTTSLKTRRINAALRPNNVFLYRIGSVKTIINIFNVKQELVNYSTYYSGATSVDEVLTVYVDNKEALDPVTPSPTQGSVTSGTSPGYVQQR